MALLPASKKKPEGLSVLCRQPERRRRPQRLCVILHFCKAKPTGTRLGEPPLNTLPKYTVAEGATCRVLWLARRYDCPVSCGI